MATDGIIGRLFRALRGIVQMIPMIIGILLLISLIINLLTPGSYSRVFTGNIILDPFIGASIGSIFAGVPVTSYLIGGELLKAGIGLLPITAFIVCWVTVGIVQAPAEILTLGRRFTIARNVISFILAIIIAILTTQTLLML